MSHTCPPAAGASGWLMEACLCGTAELRVGTEQGELGGRRKALQEMPHKLSILPAFPWGNPSLCWWRGQGKNCFILKLIIDDTSYH